jgi:RNA polymerase sigma-70 factor (ECF subfamily)
VSPTLSISPVADPTDNELVSRLLSGDAAAFTALYDRYAPLAYSVALRIVNRPDRSEDVVQEAFIKLWNSAQSFDGRRGSLRSWLMTMVRNRAIDHVRGRFRHDAEELSLTLDIQAAQGTDPFEHAAQSEERRAIASALASLSPEQKKTVELAYFGGLSQPEIAGAMGVPLSTVKGRMRLALEKLHGAMWPIARADTVGMAS